MDEDSGAKIHCGWSGEYRALLLHYVKAHGYCFCGCKYKPGNPLGSCICNVISRHEHGQYTGERLIKSDGLVR
jgi:hypothetical protein